MSRSGPSSGHGRQRGIALVLVLWVITLLAVIAGSFAFSMRTNTLLAGNHLQQASARAFADAGIHRGLYELNKSQTDAERWKADGSHGQFELEGGGIEVTMLVESAFVDLNTASDALLKALLVSAGLGDEPASRLLDAIVDWRDSDDLPRVAGAEREQYLAAGLEHAPTNKPFIDVQELRLVLGMEPELFSRISPALTVYSGQPGIDSRFSPRVVLLALPGTSEEEVDAFLAQRADLLQNHLPPAPFPPAAGFASGAEGQVYNLTSKATLHDGAIFVREAIAKLTNDPKRPYVFLNWREGQTDVSPPQSPQQSP